MFAICEITTTTYNYANKCKYCIMHHWSTLINKISKIWKNFMQKLINGKDKIITSSFFNIFETKNLSKLNKILEELQEDHLKQTDKIDQLRKANNKLQNEIEEEKQKYSNLHTQNNQSTPSFKKDNTKSKLQSPLASPVSCKSRTNSLPTLPKTNRNNDLSYSLEKITKLATFVKNKISQDNTLFELPQEINQYDENFNNIYNQFISRQDEEILNVSSAIAFKMILVILHSVNPPFFELDVFYQNNKIITDAIQIKQILYLEINRHTNKNKKLVLHQFIELLQKINENWKQHEQSVNDLINIVNPYLFRHPEETQNKVRRIRSLSFTNNISLHKTETISTKQYINTNDFKQITNILINSYPNLTKGVIHIVN